MTALLPSRKAASRRLSPLGLFEALATPHGVDRYLELVNPMLTVRELRAEVTAVHRSTTDSVTLTLRPTRQWRGFEAGQFVNVTVVINGVRRTRCYSPSCSQHRADGQIEITIKRHPEGLVSQWLHANAAPGLVVQLSQADGVFRLPAARPDQLLLISGGSGITPVLSMLRTLCDEGHAGEVVFLHYSNTEHDVALRAELLALAAEHQNVRVEIVHTESGEAVGLTDRLHIEEFQPAPIVVDDGVPTGTVSFLDTSAANSGETLLEQAESAGLTPEFGCRMGICFSCTQIKTSGCTRNIRTGELHTDPDTEIQLCINVPVGDVSIEI
jgi:NAD(P)H-flavin reductase/ferredoxin